ncbi:DUF6090 family protein [Winogradskyella sp. A3E31]|uniref:DUF6090 family protein n=1 Tax=Winogradskyella sp. A3E31 TaxID=3349637 RepID=UPI00398B9393
MEQNKTGPYIKYAIGEIILVVIGILIALQINNWNENRRTASLARSYLSDIKKDLKTDTVTFNTAIERIQKTITQNKSLLNPAFLDIISTDSLLSLLKTSYHSTRIYHIDNATYLKLSNTGFLESGLLNSIFTEINNYYNKEYVAYSEYIEWDEEQSIDVYHSDFLGTYKNIDLTRLVSKNESISNPQTTEKNINAFREFINASQFRNITWANYNRKEAVLNRLLYQKEIAKDLIKKIDSIIKD